MTRTLFCFYGHWWQLWTSASHTPHVVSLDDVAKVERCESLGASVRLELKGHTEVHVSGLQYPDKVLILLRTLVGRQQRLSAMCTQLLGQYAPHSHAGLTNVAGHTAPAGLYTAKQCRVVEETWENQRRYPFVGWTARTLPTDRPSWSDKSGYRAREPESVVLPNVDEWEWAGDWIVASGFEYAVDFKASEWHAQPSAFHMVRRRRWIRARQIKRDVVSARLL